MSKRVIVRLLVSVFIVLCSVGSGAAKAQLNRLSASGQISLDQGVAQQNLPIKVIVRRHTIDSVRTCFSVPFFRCITELIFPIQDEYSTTVVMPRGRNVVNYRLDRGLLIGIRVSIKFECFNCPGVAPEQFYTPQGSILNFSDSALLDDSTEPLRADIALKTTTSVRGSITVEGENRPESNLNLSALVFSADSGALIAATNNLIFPLGATGINYEVSGLLRGTNTTAYRIELRCNDCPPGFRVTNAPPNLAAGVNHAQANFEFRLSSAGFQPAINMLLLEDLNSEIEP